MGNLIIMNCIIIGTESYITLWPEEEKEERILIRNLVPPFSVARGSLPHFGRSPLSGWIFLAELRLVLRCLLFIFSCIGTINTVSRVRKEDSPHMYP